MDLLVVIPLLLFIPINLLLSLILFQNNPKSWTNRLFSSFIIILTVYLAFNSYLNTALLSIETKLLFSRIIIALGSLINLVAFLFLRTFPDVQIPLKKRTLIFLFSFTALLFFSGFTNLIFTGIEVVDGVTSPKPGLLMPVFLLHTFLLIGGGIFSIIRKYRKNIGINKEKIGYVLLSFFVFFTCVLVFNFILPVFLNFGYLVPFLPIYLLIFNLLVGYAIVKKKLLEIRVLVARSVAYILFVLTSALAYGLILFFLGRFVSGIQLDARGLTTSIILGVLLAVSFQPLKSFLAKVTDKIFYKDNYDSEELLYRLSIEMASTIRLEELSRKLLREIVQTMNVKQGLIILLNEGGIYQVFSEGDPELPVFDEDEIKKILSLKGQAVYDELPDSEIKEIIKKYNFFLTSEFVHEGKELGLLALGEKLSGESYLDRDVKVISIFASEAAVAIQNAKSYEEIRRFNITLEEEVESATKRLVVANEKLKELDKLKDEFVSIASHELRTPMVSIKNYIWMTLAGKGGKITQKQKFYLNRAYESSNRMTKLINDLLNISRIESGRILLNVEKANIIELCETIISEVQPRADQIEVKLILEKQAKKVDSQETAAIPEVIADKDKVAEVLINFLSNSFKFTPAQGTITVWFEVDEQNKQVITHVTDTGVGLTSEQIPKLFKKFGMLKETYRNKAEAAQGTGLGLYVSKSIIELHGGKIWVASEGQNKGSTFSFSLPIFSETELHRLQQKFHSGTDAGIVRTNLVTSE